MKQLKDFAAKAEEFRAAAIPGTSEVYLDSPIDPTGARRHDEDSIAHIDRFVDVMTNQDHRGEADLPQAKHLILHSHAREGIESSERLVKQQDFGMSNQRPGQCNTLGHATRKMVRVDIRETFKAHQMDELAYLAAFLVQKAQRCKSGLDIAPDSEPGKQIGVLEYQAALGARTGDSLRSNSKLARAWEVEPGNQAKHCGLAAAAGTDNGNQFPRRYREGNRVQGGCVRGSAVTCREIL